MKENEVYKDDYVTLGFVHLEDNSWGFYNLNINNYVYSLEVGKRVLLLPGNNFDNNYYFTPIKVKSNSVIFSLEKNKKDCFVDSDCESKTILNCLNNELYSQIISFSCKQGSCVEGTSKVNKEICDYKCEDKSCVDCQGCIQNGECLNYGNINQTYYCNRNVEIYVVKEPKATCSENYECSLKECIEGQCKNYGLLKRIWLRIKGIF
jgi:hypothetical protein